MTTPPELSSSDVARWSALAESAPTLARSPRETVRPARPAGEPPPTGALSALSALPRPKLEDELALGDVIASGGMGIVQAATQRRMGREVAVKTLRTDVELGPSAPERLLQEAWIAGALEHPNVVPVHDVLLDAAGRPCILQKRIHGWEWAELFRDARTVRARFGADDLLEWNLRVLIQTCQAVRFAHSRGILHRDIKPENVMVGEFGEVYLVDWGIAVSLDDDASGRVPLARDAVELAGTPAYMAPEMLGGARLSERTDVYLLGATLYEVLLGEPPHQGATTMELLSSVAVSEPPIPAELPPRLVAILRRALDRDPSARFENANQLRLALEGYLRSRSSQAVAAAAEERRVELFSLLRSHVPLDDAQLRRAHHLYTEARFGFRQALALSSENEGAMAALRDSAIAMIEHELSRDDPRAASMRLADLEDPPRELIERVERSLAAHARRAASLESLRREHDERIGARTRTAFVTFAGVAWTLAPLAAHVVTGGAPRERYSQLFGFSLVWSALAIVLALSTRESMMKTVVNRRVVAMLGVVLGSQLALDVGAWLLHVRPMTTMILHLELWFVIAGASLLAIDRRLFPTALANLVGFLAAAAWPPVRFLAMAATNFVLVLNVAWLWKPLFSWRASPVAVREGANGSPPGA